MLTHKTLLTFIALLVFSLYGWTAIPSLSVDPNSKDPKQTRIELRMAQMKFYSSLSLKDYEKLKGKKLNFVEKFSFKTSQHRMKKMLKNYNDDGVVSVLQKISWLCKGILLGPIALAIGYIFLKGDERELIKWIWFGFAGWVIILAAVLITI